LDAIVNCVVEATSVLKVFLPVISSSRVATDQTKFGHVRVGSVRTRRKQDSSASGPGTATESVRLQKGGTGRVLFGMNLDYSRSLNALETK
jgi:hypothetical protein